MPRLKEVQINLHIVTSDNLITNPAQKSLETIPTSKTTVKMSKIIMINILERKITENSATVNK